MKFAVFVQRTDTGYGAYCPDVPNVVSAGETIEDTLAGFQESLAVLFKLIREEGGEFPVPKTIAASVEIEGVA